MSFIAGIVRLDALTIPEDWIASLACSAGERLEVIRPDADAVFLAATDDMVLQDSGRLLLCDGRVGAGAPGGEAELAWRNIAAGPLTGDFALASWTSPDRCLVLRRSHLGTRPLFYVRRDDVFAFASSLPALLALPCISQALNEDAICRMLCFDGTGPADHSFHADVRRIPAGHCLTLDGGAFSQRALPPPWKGTASLPGGPSDAAAAVRAMLIDVVESNLLGGTTIAVHLSGGLDSATIACIAAQRLKQQGRRLLALCSVLPTDHVGPESDERHFIEAVLDQEDNIDPVWITLPTDADPFGAQPRWFECLGEPQYSTVSHVEEMLGAIGQEHGVDIVLSGFGGDFFVSARGMPATELHLRRGQFGAALSELRRLRRADGTAWWRLLRDQVARPLAGWRHRWRRTALRDAGCAAQALIRRVAERTGRAPTTSLTKFRRLPHQDMDFILEPGRLERVLPEMHQVFAKAFGQDVRFPLLDSRLIALVRGLPEEELHRDAVPRSLMRRATLGIIPEVVRLRPDKGPAFDPALAAHCVAARPALQYWAEKEAAPLCWDYVDRARFLEALDRIVPSDRDGWQREMFSVVLTGGRFAKFIDWHMRRQAVQP